MNSVNEFVIEWIRGEKTASLTIQSNTHMKNKIMKLAKESSSVDYIENKDGSIFAHVPVDWISVRKPKQMNYSEEELKKKSQLMKALKEEGKL